MVSIFTSPLDVSSKSLVPSYFNGCKIGAVDDSNFYCAFNRDVHRIELSVPSISTNSFTPTIIPPPQKDKVVYSHDYAVESVYYDNGYLYSVDCYGNGMAYNQTSAISHKLLPLSRSYIPCWNGITSDPTNPNTIATARFIDKTMTIYQNDRALYQFNSPGHPYHITYTPGLNLLTLLQNNSILLYDLRQGPVKGATITIPLLTEQSAFALSAREDVIAVGGESRNVAIFETRTWKLKGNWKNPVKYEITALHLSTNKDYCYVADDSVLLCGKWKSMNKSNTRQYFSNSMRMESRHTGITHVAKDDSIIVLTESGKIHILKNGSVESTEEEPDRKKQRTISDED